MAIGNFEEKLDLANLAKGELNEDFQKFYQMVRSALKHGDRASVDISIKIARIENSDTMYEVGYSITPKLPGKKKATICQVNGDGELLTDKVEAPKVTQLSVFEGQKAAK